MKINKFIAVVFLFVCFSCNGSDKVTVYLKDGGIKSFSDAKSYSLENNGVEIVDDERNVHFYPNSSIESVHIY